jgi:hypothetical protein
MDPHDFGLLDPHPESVLQMRIPDADADPDPAFLENSAEILSTSTIFKITVCEKKLFYTFRCFSKNLFTLKGQSSQNFVPFSDIPVPIYG